jgi:D-glycero-D-manno-heptose 1,7-bisphosphate phosphatase
LFAISWRKRSFRDRSPDRAKTRRNTADAFPPSILGFWVLFEPLENRMNERWTVFIDRDGTLVVDQGHGVDLARLELRPSAKEAIGLWKQAGWRIIGVTNNSGLARGKYTQAQMHAFHRAIEVALGTTLDAWYFCPHMPEAGCACRKPKTGMFEAAMHDHDIDAKRAFMIGDTASDMGAGAAIGARTVYVPSTSEPHPEADFVAHDLKEAARWTLALAAEL